MYNRENKNKIIYKNSISKSYISNGKTTIDYQKLYNLNFTSLQIIINRKKEYYGHLSEKFNDHLTSPKSCWSMLKTFYNGIKIL